MAKHKRKSGKGRGLGEIKRQRHKVSKFAEKRGAGERIRGIKADIDIRRSTTKGDSREGMYVADVCIARRRGKINSRCGGGVGKTPTRALAQAFKDLGKRLK